MAVPKADCYRWVGRDSDVDGAALSKVRTAPVAEAWNPVNVSWLPETAGRPSCDFPIFHPIVRCMSQHAAAVLAPFSQGNLEYLAVRGLNGNHIAAHCTRWVDTLVPEALDPSDSIHSTLHTPRLMHSAVAGLDIFGVEPMVAKLFVSPAVRAAIEAAGLTGLEFYSVELA